MEAKEMTYKETYSALPNIDAIKEKAREDVLVAIFFGANPDRIRAIEVAMNEAIRDKEGSGQ